MAIKNIGDREIERKKNQTVLSLDLRRWKKMMMIMGFSVPPEDGRWKKILLKRADDEIIWRRGGVEFITIYEITFEKE